MTQDTGYMREDIVNMVMVEVKSEDLEVKFE